MTSYARRLQLPAGSRFGSATAVAILHLGMLVLFVAAFAVTVSRTAPADPTSVIDIISTPAMSEEEVAIAPASPETASGGGSPLPSVAPDAATLSAASLDRTIAPLAPALPTVSGPAAADLGGSGSASGSGTGTGSGADAGSGPSGGQAALSSRARRIKGYISSEDYPAGPLRSKIQGTTGVELTISVAGRVSACSVVKTSGNGELDWTVCRLAQQRFVFQPARDRSGSPANDTKREYFTWVLPR